MYHHSNKEENWDTGEELGMDERTIRDAFAYALSEVEFDVLVDTETGETEILAVDGRTVLPETTEITRFEVIDHTKSLEEGGGRTVIYFDPNKMLELSLQDDNRTLKIFVQDRK